MATPDQISLMARNPFFISEFESPDEHLQLVAVRLDGMVIRHIKTPSDAVKMNAVQSDPLSLRYIENPTPEMQYVAVMLGPKAMIQWISNPDHRIIEIIQEYCQRHQLRLEPTINGKFRIRLGDNFRWTQIHENYELSLAVASEMNERQLMLAINAKYDGKNTDGFLHQIAKPPWNRTMEKSRLNKGFPITYFIENPPWQIKQEEALKNPRFLAYEADLSKEFLLRILKRIPTAIQYIHRPDDDLQNLLLSILGYTDLIKCAEKIYWPISRLQIDCLRDSIDFIEGIKNPSEESLNLFHETYGKEGFTLVKVPQGFRVKYIKDPPPVEQQVLCHLHGKHIKYLNNPSVYVQMLAVEADPESLGYINNPKYSVLLTAIQLDGNCIRFINQPSESLELLAMEENTMSLFWIASPREGMLESLCLYPELWGLHLVTLHALC